MAGESCNAIANGEPCSLGPGSGGVTITEVARNSLTGLTRLAAGILSINAGDNTKIDIAAGTGQVVDNTTNPSSPTLTAVTWGAFSALTDDFLLTDPTTTWFIDATGSVVQMDGQRDAEDRRDLIFLGFSVHQAQTVEESVSNIGTIAGANAGMTFDLASALGDINIFGNVYTANGVNLLLDKSVGEVFGEGIGTVPNPNFADTALQTGITTYLYTFQPAVPGNDFNSQIEVDIDPNNFDDGSGALVAVSANKFTIQRLVFEPRTGLSVIEYGQKEYNSLGEAVDGITENNIVANPALRNLLLRGWLVVKEGTTDLTNAANAALFENVSENPAGAASGAGITGVDVQDNSVTQATAVPILNFVFTGGTGGAIGETPAGTAKIEISSPELAVLAPQTTSTANAVGTATKTARDDHVHETGLGIQDQSVAQGDAHTVNFVGVGVAVVDLTAGVAAVRIDGSPIGNGTPVVVDDGAASNGSSPLSSREDHKHALAIPVQDEGGAAADTNAFDFVGAGVSVAVVSGKATVTVPGGGGAADIIADSVSLGTSATQSSTADAVVNGMTITPPAGDYVVMFWCDAELDFGEECTFSIYAAGTQEANSEVTWIPDEEGRQPICLIQRVSTVNGAQAIEARVRTGAAGADSVSFLDRRLLIIKEG